MLKLYGGGSKVWRAGVDGVFLDVAVLVEQQVSEEKGSDSIVYGRLLEGTKSGMVRNSVDLEAGSDEELVPVGYVARKIRDEARKELEHT